METQQIIQLESQQPEVVREKNTFWKSKKLLIAVPIVIVLILFIMVIAQKKVSENLSPSFSPTPTPITPPTNGYQNLSIKISPADGSIGISLFATISATFSRPLTPAEKTYTKIALTPTSAGIITWSKDNTTTTFIPSIHLSTGTTYHVTLTYGSSEKAWSFNSVSNENVSQQDANNVQVQSDESFGQWQNQIYNNYPWYNNLPLQTNEYFTYFDIGTKEFISSLYVSPSEKEKVQSLKQEITQKLQQLGVNTSEYKFVWNITP